jgi:uncharacterized phage-associated protein
MYNSAKAAQIIAYFALKSPKRLINMLKAIKLVYIADRESARIFATPMLDELRSSLPLGPVNSQSYDLAKGEAESEGWTTVLQDREEHQIGVKPGIVVDDLDELSEAETEILEDVWKQFGHMNQWQLVDWTHNPKNVPEWEDPGSSSNPIPLERLLMAVGIENAAEQAEFLRDQSAIDKIFADLAA